MMRMCGLLTFCFVGAAAAQPIAFRLAPRFGVGAQPSRVAIADLDGDGHADVVVAQAGGLAVSRGLGGGRFGEATAYAAPALGEVVAADVDNDGDADVLAADTGGARLLLFRNDGTGVLAPPEGFAAIAGATDLAAADFTGDGWIDVAVSGFGGARLVVGDGAGGFSGTRPITLGSDFAVLTAGLVSDDGLPDLAAAGSAGVEIAFNHLGLSFATPVVFTPGTGAMNGVALADADGDGLVDLLASGGASGEGEGGLWVIRNVGFWQFAPPVGYELAQSRRIVACDVDGDGDADVVGVNRDANSVSVVINEGGVYAERRNWGVGARPGDVGVADVDGDGLADIVAPSGDGADFAVLTHRDAGGFDAREDFHFIGEPRGVALADLDGDGMTDVVTGVFIVNRSRLAVRRGLGEGRLAPAEYTGRIFGYDGEMNSAAPRDVAAGDLNGDGAPDVVVSLFSPSSALMLALNDGAGGLVLRDAQDELLFTTGIPSDVEIADVTRDGIDDLVAVVGNSGTPGVAVFAGDGEGGFAGETLYVAGEHPVAIALGDLDGDGDTDGVLASDIGSALIVLRNGDGAFVYETLDAGGPQTDVAIADVDGDGRPDIVLARGQAAVMYGEAGGSFGAPVGYGGEIDAVGVADLNGDGRPDLVGVDRFAGTLTVIAGRGGRAFAPPRVHGGGYGAQWLAPARLDAGATLDLVVANRDGRSVTAFLQRCPADFNADDAVNTLDVLAFLNAWSAGDPAADFTGDGAVNTLDVLAFLNSWTAGC